MKALRQALAIIIALFLLFSAAPALAGLFSSKTDDAQKKLEKAISLMAINLNDEANKLINEAKTEVINELINDPDNNQALFVLAQAETYLNDQKNAKIRFQKACQRDSTLCEQIYSFYEKLADAHEKMGNPSLTISYRIAASDYKPGSKGLLAEEFFRNGAKLLHSGNYHAAVVYFSASSGLDPGYNTAITTAIRDSAKKLPDPCAQMLLYRYAFNYSPPAMNQELFQLAAQVLKDCKEQTVKKEFNLIRQDYRALIQNIAYPPDYKVYQRGHHPINLKAGEKTKYRVEYPNGTYPSIKSHDNMFKFIYPNGEIIEAWKIKTMPKSGYWIEAVTNQQLVLNVE